MIILHTIINSYLIVSNSPSRETTFQNQIEQLRRENERLRNQVQRSKLHLKGNNASTSSFRERTASVAAPALTESSANTVSSSAEQDSSPPIADSSSSPSKRMSRLSMSSSSTDSSSRKRHKQPKRVPSSTSSLQTDDRRSSVDSRFRSATAIGPAPPLDHNNEVLYSHMTMQPADFLNDAASPGNHIGGLAATTANIPMDPRLLQGPDMMLFSPPTPAPQQPEVPYSNAPQMLNVAAMHSQHHPQQQQILPGAFLTPQQASMIGDFLSFMDARYPQLYPASFMPVSFQQTAASSSTTASSTSGTSVGTFPQPYIQTNSNEGTSSSTHAWPSFSPAVC